MLKLHYHKVWVLNLPCMKMQIACFSVTLAGVLRKSICAQPGGNAAATEGKCPASSPGLSRFA